MKRGGDCDHGQHPYRTRTALNSHRTFSKNVRHFRLLKMSPRHTDETPRAEPRLAAIASQRHDRERFLRVNLGGSDVVNASRRCLDVPALRSRLRRLFVFTVAHTVSYAHTRRAVIVRHHSRGRRVAGKPGVLARRSGYRGGHDCQMDECRLGAAHIDVGRERLEFRNGRTRRTVRVHVPDSRNVHVSLHDSPGNGRNGCRSVSVR